jgi:16S rRNA (guanine527-N7)-methyltransferase
MVTLLDASQKKCGFMQQVAIELKLGQVQVIHARVEDFHVQFGFPQIVSRAFSELREFVGLTRHLLSDGGEWLAMKGVYPNEEVTLLKEAHVKRDIKLHVPGLDADRHLIVMEAE